MTIIVSAEGLDTVIMKIEGKDIYKIRGGGVIAEEIKSLVKTGDRRGRLPHVFLLEELNSLSRKRNWEVIAY